MDNNSHMVAGEMTQNHASDNYNEPTYNLKAVVRETGLKADTLRAWERRYGLPNPQRTKSGHRLYSKRDIGILKWLLGRQQEGLSISRAVVLWQRLTEEGIDPIDVSELESIPSALNPQPVSSNQQPVVTSSTPPILATHGQIADLRQEWITACLIYDEVRAEQTIASAFSLFDTETVCMELLLKGMSEIGQGWSQGRVTAQQEHFASSLAIRRLHALLIGTPAPTKTGKILMGCPAGEEHVFPATLLSLLLRRRGWNVLFLGPNVPVDNLSSTVATIRPDLMILTAQQLNTAGSLLEMGQSLLESNVPLAYGGAIFMRSPELQRCIPGHYLGDKIEQAPIFVEQIMAAPRIRHAQQNIPMEHLEGLRCFREKRGQLESRVGSAMQIHGISRALVDDANYCMGQNIAAALSLCKVGLTEAELDDVAMLLVHHYKMPSAVVDEYLIEYCNAAASCFDDRGQIVLTWLERITQGYETAYA